MREIDKIAEGLFEKIRDRFEDVSLGDENAKATSSPDQARFFNFDYVVNGHNHGNITMSLIDELSLKVYFSKNISSELSDDEKREWYSFLRELREFARRNLLSFEPRDITRSTLKHRDIQQQSKADSTYTKDDVVTEGRMYGTQTRSFESFGPVRIKLQHSKPIVDEEARGIRSRNIQTIFVENDQGERFRLPFTNLTGARAMARHVSAGGVPTDELGSQITNMVNEMLTLRPFVRGMAQRTFEDTVTKEMVESAFGYHSLLKNTLKKMKGKRGYTEFKDNFKPALVEDEVNVEDLKDLFVKKTLDERIEQALPLVYKAHTIMKENTNPFAQQFESWANNVAEGSWALPQDEETLDQLIDLLSEPLTVGVDATNATSALYNIIGDDKLFDRLEDLAQEDPEADARDAIMQWVYDEMPETYSKILAAIGDEDTGEDSGELAEAGGDTPVSAMSRAELISYLNTTEQSANGKTDDELRDAANEKSQDYAADNVNEGDYDEDQVESIQTAIIRRILNNIGQHQELLMKAGPDGVMNAARDVASFHAPVEELGSSDISIMVREVYNEVGVEYPELAEEMKRQSYEDYLKDCKAQGRTPVSKEKWQWSQSRFKESVNEGRVKEVEMDLKDLSDEDFKQKYNKTKEEMKAALAENVGDDVVNKDEKLKRMGAKELNLLDKLKTIPHGIKAMVKGEPEDDVSLYNRQFKEEIEQMRKIAGLK